jgi:hypothetical protein
MSGAWFRSFAKTEAVTVAGPGVDCTTVEDYIARSQVRSVDGSLRRHADPGRPVRGVTHMDRVHFRFGWSDWQLACASEWRRRPGPGCRRSGVPELQASRSRRLSRLPLDQPAPTWPRYRR